MPKTPKISEVWVLFGLVFIVFFLTLSVPVRSYGGTLWHKDVLAPQLRHLSSTLPTNPVPTTNPQSVQTAGAVFFEDTKMVDATIYVSSQAELYEALKNATGGETILLAPGEYGILNMSEWNGFDRSLTNPIEIKSLDKNNPASFSEVHLRGVSDYKFSDLVFDYNFSALDPSYFRPFTFDYCSNIQILDSQFEGDVASGISEAADGYGYAYGLSVRGSENVVVIGNEFTTWLRAAIFSDTENLIVSENEIHSIRSDGLDLVQVANVVIEGNYIHDFATSPTSGDHVDYIQFWTSGTNQPSTNILIRENVLDMGDGGWSQSIFLRNEQVDRGLAGIEMYYQDVVIEQNLILGGHSHGITVGETSGLLIQGNTVLAAPNPDSTVNIPTINVAQDSIGVSILGNAVARINGYVEQTDWILAENAFIQNTDPNAPGYYSDVFVESSMFGQNGVADYVVAPGSMLENLQAGYSGLFSFSSNQNVRALFDVSTSAEDIDLLVIDGRYSFGSGGAPLPDGSTFVWKLNTGETFSGPVLLHRFESPGHYDIELVVTTPDGSSSVAFARVSVAGQDLLSFDETTGSFLAHGYGETEAILKSVVASTEVSSGAFAIDVGGSGTQSSVSRQAIERIFGAESMSLSFSLQADAQGSYGEVFRIHSSFVASITATGELQFQFFSSSGEKILLKTAGAEINDSQFHEISIVLDGRGDSLSIAVDGAILAETPVYGNVPFIGYWDLAFGNPWDSSKNFDGKILSFDLDVSNNDYSFYSGDNAAVVANGDLAEPLLAGVVAPVEEVIEIGDTYIAPVELQPSQMVEPIDERNGPAYPELAGYKLNLASLSDGSEGKLIGDAFIGHVSDVASLVLDGKNDSARIGNLGDYDNSSVLALEISFARSGYDSSSQTLVANHSRATVSLIGDSIAVSIGDRSSKDTSAHFSVEDLGILDFSTHSLRIVADDQSNHIQMFVDEALVYDRSELEFDFDTAETAKSWWNQGWSIGEGGRRDGDFAGVITDFQIDDTALFV